MMRLTTLFTLLLLLVGCSSKPVLPTEGYNREILPKAVTELGEEPAGKQVLWGGIIINSTNLEGRTRLEILSYPLDKELRPQNELKAGGRFLAFQKGYLETVDYSAGRQVSLVGTISGTEEARLGEHSYHYPAVDVEQLHLWPVESGASKSRLHFGIGVMFHN